MGQQLGREIRNLFEYLASIGMWVSIRALEKGNSMVVELLLADNTWTSFVSARLPQELDDAIKGKHAEFYLAARDLSPSELLAAVPMSFPMTHLVDGFPGVARYPVDEWEAAGAPMMTLKSWAKLCMRVSMNDLSNLQHVLDVAKKYDSPAFDV